MKKLMITAAVIAAPGFAMAGGYLPPVVEVVPPPPPIVYDDEPTYSWQGLYAGGAAAYVIDGHRRYNFPADPDEELETGFVYGAFVGYNMQWGKFVVGPEVQYTFNHPASAVDPTEDMGGIFDAKLRAGFAAGRALPYIFAAYSFGSYQNPDSNMSGISYGGGIDFLVTEHIFVGADVTLRRMDGTGADPVDYNSTAVGLRVGFKF